MMFITLLLFCQAVLVWSGTPYHQPNLTPVNDKCPTSQVELRPTPLLNATTPRTWQEPSSSFNYGYWALTYSTQASFKTVFNAQVGNIPVFPSDPSLPSNQRHQITSIQTANISTIFTIHLIDTPSSLDPSSCYDSRGTGLLINTTATYCIMAYGYDTHGVGYILEYEAASQSNGGAPALNLLSRVEDGPSMDTFNALVNGILKLGNAEVVGLVKGLTKLQIDGRRTGVTPVPCPQSCVANTDIASVE